VSRDQQGTLTEDAGTDQERLPADDPALASRLFDLDGLAAHWAARAALPPMTAEQIRGADARAQRLGISGDRLMEQAGAAVAAAARAMVRTTQREAVGPILILCGPGNNGGDGLVAARRLSASGIPTVVALVSADARPAAPDAARNWDRLAGSPDVERIHVSAPRDVRILMAGAERASIVVDALLGTGTTGSLREPIRTTVELLERARAAGVPVLAVDTPTSLDLTSGVPSMPVVHADATITFHRPKVGLRGREGRVLAGQVLVAPIGIPPEADPG
jgi:hydroxyethylthiazole kinase-like uncharacterized protein yjeF